MKKKDISVVLPVYNEKDNIEILYKELKEVLEKLNKSYEIIFVDDGSTDGSNEVMKRIASQDPKVVLIEFRRNFGQTAAMDAGFKAAVGEVIIPMDADLQNDPKDIPRLLEKIEEGFDVVKGYRKNRKDKGLTRKLPSKIANFIIRKATGVNIHDFGCTLTAFRSDIIKEINLYGEMHRFIPVYTKMVGGKITEIVVNHRPRKFGKTKYNLSRTFKVLFDLLTVKFFYGYAPKPLYFFGKWSLFSFFISFVTLVWTAYKKFALGVDVHKNPLFLIAIFFALAGIQTLLMGVLAEVMIRGYFESQGKTFYIIKKIYRKDEQKKDHSDPSTRSEDKK